MRLDLNSPKPLFQQVLDHDIEKAAYAIVTHFNGSFMVNALYDADSWVPHMHRLIVDNYLLDYSNSEPFMESWIYENRDSYAITSEGTKLVSVAPEDYEVKE